MYSIESGDKAGAFIVFIKEESIKDNCAVLLMPSPMDAMYIHKTDLIERLKNDDIKLVKKLPREVYDVCRANFIYYAKKNGIYANK